MGERKSKKCIICGEKTEQQATVYVGRERRTEGGRVTYDYRSIEKPLCPSCAGEHFDHDPMRWLFPLVLQLGWFTLARDGWTFLGIIGLIFAAYGLARLIMNVGSVVWGKLKPGEELPRWLAGDETLEDKASACLKAYLKKTDKSYVNSSEHLETVREYLRRHPAKAE